MARMGRTAWQVPAAEGGLGGGHSELVWRSLPSIGPDRLRPVKVGDSFGKP